MTGVSRQSTITHEPDSVVSGTRPLARQLEETVAVWASSQYELVTLAAQFADSPEWILTGSPTPAHWLAIIADVEPCTTREWIRIGRCLQGLPQIAEALRTRAISYSKARALTRLASPDNETELLEIATTTTAADLGRALAAWLHRTSDPEDLAGHHQRQRSVKWRTEPDGMTLFTLRLPPLLAGMLISFLTTWVMRTRPKRCQREPWPTVAQQHADALAALLTGGAGDITSEVVVHVTGDGNTLDDGTPLPDSVVADLIPHAFISALIHDATTTRSTPPTAAATPPVAKSASSKPATNIASTAAATNYSNTTTPRPTNKPATPSPANSPCAAHLATNNTTAGGRTVSGRRRRRRRSRG